MLSTYVTKINNINHGLKNQTSALLFDINELLIILSDESLSLHTKKNIERLLIQKVLVIATIKPTIPNLKSDGLLTLKRLLDYQKFEKDQKSREKLKELAFFYLNNIKMEVYNNIKIRRSKKRSIISDSIKNKYNIE